MWVLLVFVIDVLKPNQHLISTLWENLIGKAFILLLAASIKWFW